MSDSELLGLEPPSIDELDLPPPPPPLPPPVYDDMESPPSIDIDSVPDDNGTADMDEPKKPLNIVAIILIILVVAILGFIGYFFYSYHMGVLYGTMTGIETYYDKGSKMIKTRPKVYPIRFKKDATLVACIQIPNSKNNNKLEYHHESTYQMKITSMEKPNGDTLPIKMIENKGPQNNGDPLGTKFSTPKNSTITLITADDYKNRLSGAEKYIDIQPMFKMYFSFLPDMLDQWAKK
eukprot:Pgem_evm2s16705